MQEAPGREGQGGTLRACPARYSAAALHMQQVLPPLDIIFLVALTQARPFGRTCGRAGDAGAARVAAGLRMENENRRGSCGEFMGMWNLCSQMHLVMIARVSHGLESFRVGAGRPGAPVALAPARVAGSDTGSRRGLATVHDRCGDE
jgi:hypothetical protein